MVILKFLRNSLGVLRQSLRIAKANEVYVGVDQHGNKYYEKAADPSVGMKKVRRVQPVNADITVVPTVPVEWMTWLQERRPDPPTQKEIEENYVQMVKVQHRATKLEGNSQAQMLEADTADQKSLSVAPSQQTSTQVAGFPKYDDYEIIPGDKKDLR